MAAMNSITVTKIAIKNITRLQKENNAVGHGLRYGLTGGGCSGYKYILEFEKDKKNNDLIFNIDNIKIFVNIDHMIKLKNSTIDWVDSLRESGFKIDNPQAKQPCGCGESVNF